MTEADLRRGQQRFNIYCALCHGAAGDGNGKIVERGYLRPPSYHTDPEGKRMDTASTGRTTPDLVPGGLPQGYSRGFGRFGVRVAIKDVPVGYIFEVITKGYGGMPDYAFQIPVPDRWRIAAYVRVLQISQSVDPAKLPPEQRADLDKALGGQR
jgi:mono/diheme cytochrome c family protein